MTTAVEQQQIVSKPRTVGLADRWRPLAFTLLLTLWCIAVGGYHPYAEDGGIYLASIKWLLNPHLYPAYTGFVTAHLHLSVFPRLVVFLVRASRLPLMSVMLLLHVASVWLTLLAGWTLARECFRDTTQRVGATLFFAAGLTLPIAGTSLMLMDPYVTSRSFSTPLGLFALAAAADALSCVANRKGVVVPLMRCLLLLALCSAIHPLMAAYTLLCVVLLATLSLRRGGKWLTGAVVVCVVLLAGALAYTSQPASAAYLRAAQTRTYWFPGEWLWFEWLGLLAPLAIFCCAAFMHRGRFSSVRRMASMAAVATLTSMIVAVLFAHVNSSSMLVASLQPLRQLHILYCLMLLGLGAALGKMFGRRGRWQWPVLMIVLGGILCFVQRATFPASQHLEFPWSCSENKWQQAFVWIQQNTPPEAVFALDSTYTSASGEDAQNFKAIAERSSLPDYSKDGGIASIASQLAPEWVSAQALGENLGAVSDAKRIARFTATPVRWLVLPASTATRLTCPYGNGSVRVCRLP